MTYVHCKTATTLDGKKVRVGDKVKPVSYYTKKEFGTICTITDMWKQGMDGTIARFDIAPDPEYPHHFSHRISQTNSL